MTVKVPTFRDDVEREADIAEEIASSTATIT